ncbi:unnamed protein product [Larinioides sclopetarius]|uniref:Uncharacterized protein n=1 Tax=Larinioides sclopetarius TaxID=280406 RepID=A0AAV2A941_9ARAC
MKTFTTSLENFSFENEVLNIENQGKYFDFFQIASKRNLNTRSWDELFKRSETSISDFFKSLEGDVDEVASVIEKSILSFFNRISEDFRNQLDKKIKLLRIQEIPLKLTIYSDSVIRIVEKCKNAMSIKEHLEIIYDATRDMSINMPNDTALKIIKLENSFRFLQNFSEKNDFALSSEWIHPFQNLVGYLNEAKTWYSFLDSIIHTFSKYKIQKVKEKYNVTDLENWGKSKARQGIFITKTNFQHFIEKISELNIADLDKIKNLNLTGIRQEELKEVLNLTLKGQPKIDFQPPSAFLTGDYIRISYIKNDPEISLLLQAENLKFLYVFASHTIFIDEDLILPGLGVALIAPKWEIIGDRKINLDGTDGETHSSVKASDGTAGATKGERGIPGLPGKPGGTFFGIGESFVNGAHLIITANGGNGGPGQHGGNGLRGNKGLNARMPTSGDSPSQQEIQAGIHIIGGFACEQIAVNNAQGKGIFGLLLDSVTPDIIINKIADYKIIGVSGTIGGDGGDGGKGGEGGNPGVINLIELNENSGIFKQLNRGVCGIDGKGGEGGLGGYRGNSIIARCHMIRSDILVATFGVSEKTDWEFQTMIDDHDQEDSGSPGVDGANNRGSLAPEPVNIIFDSSEIVSSYKEHLFENLTCRFKRLSLLSFLNKIN